MLLILALFGSGVVSAILESLGWYQDPSLTFRYYQQLLSSREIRASLGFSLGVAAASTGLSAAFGLMLALRLRRAARGWAGWTSPKHFVALAAQCMRQILIDHARHKKRKKRGGGNDQPRLDAALEVLEKTSGWSDSEALDAALRRLGEIQPRAAQVVQMRFFGELTMEQIAAVLDCSTATIERDWRYARAWLRKRLSDDHG